MQLPQRLVRNVALVARLRIAVRTCLGLYEQAHKRGACLKAYRRPLPFFEMSQLFLSARVPRMFQQRPLLCLSLILALMLTPAGLASGNTPLQDAIARLTPEQQATLKAYESAQAGYVRRLDLYWRLAELKRKKRKAKIAAGRPVSAEDYVREQPPVYKGPKRPDEIMALLPKPPKPPVQIHTRIPLVADFLREAEAVYGFKPDRVSEDDFMISYALEAIRLGFTRDQVVRLYALETGGMGTHDLQSGFSPRTGRAASTGIGYAQLLAANSIEQVRKEGAEFAARLDRLAAEAGSSSKAQALQTKAVCVRRMIADARKVPESWAAHTAYAKTANGLGMHALNLDGDVGPWMQTIKLRGIMEFAAKKGITRLTGAELEMMNLAGPGSGYEMLTPPGRDMPTANFFERGGYERNPVVHDKTGVQLLAKLNELMDKNVQQPGAQQFARIFDGIARRLAGRGNVRTSAETAWPFNLFGSQ